MDSLTEPENAAVLRELQRRHPGMRIWRESLGHAGSHWMARGNPSPWLILSADLVRFRAALGEADPDGDDELGRCAYPHPGPCEWPGENPA